MSRQDESVKAEIQALRMQCTESHITLACLLYLLAACGTNCGKS